MPDEKKSPYRLFLSYRREDHPDLVHHVYSWFVWHFGRGNVFMDFESTSSGAEFAETIREAIKNCDALVAIVGPEWKRIMREKAFEEEDFVRSEIALALEEKKLVVPLCIKGTGLPKPSDLPAQCRPMLSHQASSVESGAGFIDSITRVLNSIDRMLANRVARRQEADSLDAVSPASGLALGYYVNFLGPVLNGFTAVSPENPGEYLSAIEIGERGQTGGVIYEFGKPLASRENLKLLVVIPPRIDWVKGAPMAAVKATLKQATIRLAGSPRPIILDAWKGAGGYQLVDIPATITVLENWIQRRLKQECLKPNSDEARQLEGEELGRFERMLKWWAEDELRNPDLQGRIQIIRFSPDLPELEWLAAIWKAWYPVSPI